jgi:UDP-2,3-diacylglucosamine pyrophosphatase LpxH
MQSDKQYRTIIMSDVHLGTSGSKARQATAFIKEYSCEQLILNGDIIDGWQLKKYGSWKKKYTAFLRAILKTIEKSDTKVYYLRGNHDDFLDQILPFSIGPNFRIMRDMILESGNKKYFITHGDLFDLVIGRMKWLAYIGDVGYTFLLWINKKYNHYRRAKGLPYYSLSKKVKNSIKLAVNYVSDFEEKLAELAISQNCDGIICGHIHQPAIKYINGIEYMNSGDWVENMSALVEDHEGNWEIIYYTLQEQSDSVSAKTAGTRHQADEETEVELSYAHLFNLK